MRGEPTADRLHRNQTQGHKSALYTICSTKQVCVCMCVCYCGDNQINSLDADDTQRTAWRSEDKEMEKLLNYIKHKYRQQKRPKKLQHVMGISRSYSRHLPLMLLLQQTWLMSTVTAKNHMQTANSCINCANLNMAIKLYVSVIPSCSCERTNIKDKKQIRYCKNSEKPVCKQWI